MNLIETVSLMRDGYFVMENGNILIKKIRGVILDNVYMVTKDGLDIYVVKHYGNKKAKSIFEGDREYFNFRVDNGSTKVKYLRLTRLYILTFIKYILLGDYVSLTKRDFILEDKDGNKSIVAWDKSKGKVFGFDEVKIVSDMYGKLMYKYSDKFDLYFKNAVSILDDNYTVEEALNDGLKVLKPTLNNKDVLISNDGFFYFIKDCTIRDGNKYVNLKYSKSFKINGTYASMEILLYTAFSGKVKERDAVITYINNNPKYLNINNLELSTRSNVTKRYHREHKDHYEKYLKPKQSSRSNYAVSVDSIEYPSIIKASEAVKDKMKKLGYDKSLSSIKTLIYRHKDNDAYKIYNLINVSVDKIN